MRKYYLLFGVCLLLCEQTRAQSSQLFASASNQPAAESLSLKRSLSELEKKFDVSIAYKDEWIENKTVEKSDRNFSTIEEALQGLLEGTDLYFEKAGIRFYVVSLKSLKAENASQRAALSNDPDLSIAAYQAPAIVISGKVSDEKGADFPGVNIVVKGTTNGTTTDATGKYTLSIDSNPEQNPILVFSFVGYVSQEIAIAARSTIDISMQPDIQVLGEVVVTALGIEKSSKSLGYATTKVSSDQFSINRSANIMNSLQGKIAGVNISALGTGPGGTSKIRIRGQSSINGQNNPLIVINGVPIDNTNFGTNPGNTGSDNSVGNRGGGATTDGGDGLTSINPDDVENMTEIGRASCRERV